MVRPAFWLALFYVVAVAGFLYIAAHMPGCAQLGDAVEQLSRAAPTTQELQTEGRKLAESGLDSLFTGSPLPVLTQAGAFAGWLITGIIARARKRKLAELTAPWDPEKQPDRRAGDDSSRLGSAADRTAAAAARRPLFNP